jgi:hypothetical protein
MNTSVFPTSYLPPINYFIQLVKQTDIVIDIHEHYIKQSLRNRCEILGANGKLSLSVPVVKRDDPHTPVKEIRIAYHLPWQKIHRRAIESAYNSSPFFLYYQDELLSFYEKHFTFLIDFNAELLQLLFDQIGVKTIVKFSDSYIEKSTDIMDFRNYFLLKDNADNNILKNYIQVFSNKFGFIPNLSVIDLIFNLGPETLDFLIKP